MNNRDESSPPHPESTRHATTRRTRDVVHSFLAALALNLRSPWSLFWQLSGALLYALSYDLFLLPGSVAPGGLSGLSLVIDPFVPIPNGVLLLLLNVPLLLLGAVRLGGARFLARTLVVVVATIVAIDLLALVLPAEGVTSDPLLNALYGGVLGGIGSGLVIRGDANIGGTAILGRVVQRRTGVPISQVYLATDGLIVVLLGASFGWERALYSLLAVFVYGLASDYATDGPSVVRTAFIVTERPKAVAAALQRELATGVTRWHAEGMYQERERSVLFCTIARAEVNPLTEAVRAADPNGFVVIGQGHRARGGTIGKGRGA